MKLKTYCFEWIGNSGIKSYVNAASEAEAITKLQEDHLKFFGHELKYKKVYELKKPDKQ